MTKDIPTDEAHQQLLFRQFILEYVNDETWGDIFPVLHSLPMLREQIAKLKDDKRES